MPRFSTGGQPTVWFRNLQIYRLVEPFEYGAEDLEKALGGRRFKPCAGLDTHSLGWAPAAGADGTQLVHTATGRLVVCLQREDRLLPPSVIREEVEQRAAEVSTREGRPVGRKERRQLRDDVIVDLLPRAFTRNRYRHAYIDPPLGLLIVDCGTANQAEELLSQLRESLGSLRATPLTVAQTPSAVLTRWLERRPPRGMQLGDECELREPVDNGAVVRGRRVDLAGGDLRPQLDAGLLASRVAITWQDRLTCVVGEDLGVRRLRFTDLVLDEAADVAAEDPLARFDADFVLMSNELAGFVPDLIDAFGGLEAAGD
jgi:recombination associated protein RdgC